MRLSKMLPLDEPLQEAAADEPLQEAAADEPLKEACVDEHLEEAAADESLQEAAADEPLQEAAVDKPLQGPAVDDPLQEAAVDEPLQGPAVDEPLQEAAADEPLQEAAADEPLQEAATDEPLQEAAVDEPLQESAADEPLLEAAADEPLLEAAADEPLQEAAADEPLQEAAADEPLQEAAADEPLQEAAADEPLQEAAADEPLQEAAADEPLQETAADEPLQEAAADEPLQEAAADEPLQEAAADEPLQEAAVDEPLQEAAVDEPLQEAAVDEPLQGPAVDEPLREAALDEPLQGPAVDEPLQEAAVDEPLREAAVDEPLREAAVNEPLQEAAVDEPLQEAAVDEPLQEAAVDEPLQEAAVDEPLQEAAVDEPLQVPAVDEPLQDAAVDEPLQVPAVDEPLQVPAVDEPLQVPAVDEPLQVPAVDEPLQVPAVDEPLQVPAVDEPLQVPAVDEPLQVPAVDEPLQVPAVDEPLQVPAVDEPLQVPAVDEPLQVPAVDEPLQVPAVDGPLQVPAVDEPLQVPAVDEPLQVPAVDEPLEEHVFSKPSQDLGESVQGSFLSKDNLVSDISFDKTWPADHPLKNQRTSSAARTFKPKVGEIYSIALSHLSDDLTLNIQFNEQEGFFEMSEKIKDFVEHGNKVQLVNPIENSFCLAKYSVDGDWYRARFLGRKNKETCLVVFFDYGNYEVLNCENLLQLPEEFWSVHAQDVHAEFNIKQSCVHHDKSGVINILSGLDPSCDLKAIFSCGSYGQLLISDIFVEGESLVPVLCCSDCGNLLIIDQNASDDQIDPIIPLQNIAVPDVSVQMDELVCVNVNCTSKEKICVSRNDTVVELLMLKDRLNFFIIMSRPKALSSEEIFPGVYCSIQLNQFEPYVRAKVVEVLKDDFVSVHIIDSGTTKILTKQDLFPLPDKFRSFPAQGIQCVLSESLNSDLNHKLSIMDISHPGDVCMRFKEAEECLIVTELIVSDTPIDALVALTNSTLNPADTLSDFTLPKVWTSTTKVGSKAILEAEFLDSVSTPESSVVEFSYHIPLGNFSSDKPAVAHIMKVHPDCKVSLQLQENKDEWELLMNKLQNYMNSACILPFSCCPVETTYCIAKNSDTGDWYRGRVCKLSDNTNEERYVQIENVDTGDVQETLILNTFPLPLEFAHLPSRLVVAYAGLNLCPDHEGCTGYDNLCRLPKEIMVDLATLPDGAPLIQQITADGAIVSLFDICKGVPSTTRSHDNSKKMDLVGKRSLGGSYKLLPIPEVDEENSDGSQKCSLAEMSKFSSVSVPCLADIIKVENDAAFPKSQTTDSPRLSKIAFNCERSLLSESRMTDESQMAEESKSQISLLWNSRLPEHFHVADKGNAQESLLWDTRKTDKSHIADDTKIQELSLCHSRMTDKSLTTEKMAEESLLLDSRMTENSLLDDKVESEKSLLWDTRVPENFHDKGNAQESLLWNLSIKEKSLVDQTDAQKSLCDSRLTEKSVIAEDFQNPKSVLWDSRLPEHFLVTDKGNAQESLLWDVHNAEKSIIGDKTKTENKESLSQESVVTEKSQAAKQIKTDKSIHLTSPNMSQKMESSEGHKGDHKVCRGQIVNIDKHPFSVWIVPFDEKDALNFIESTLAEDWLDYNEPEDIAFRCLYGALLEDRYCRATVLNTEEDSVTVLFVDCGVRKTVARNLLRQIPDDLTEVSPIASQLFLPVKIQKVKEAAAYLEESCLGKDCVFMKISNDAPSSPVGNQRMLDLVVVEKLGDLSTCLVEAGFALFRNESYELLTKSKVQTLIDDMNQMNQEKTECKLFSCEDLQRRLDSLTKLLD